MCLAFTHAINPTIPSNWNALILFCYFFSITTFPGYLLLSHVLQAAVGRERCAQQSPLPAWRSNSQGKPTATKTTPHTPLTCKVREQRQKVARTSMKSKQRQSFAWVSMPVSVYLTLTLRCVLCPAIARRWLVERGCATLLPANWYKRAIIASCGLN